MGFEEGGRMRSITIQTETPNKIYTLYDSNGMLGMMTTKYLGKTYDGDIWHADYYPKVPGSSFGAAGKTRSEARSKLIKMINEKYNSNLV